MDKSRTTEPEQHVKAKPESSSDPSEITEYARGTQIGGRFRIEERLGGGGMSVVYRCSDQAGRVVAVKFLKSQLATEDKWINRFKQEAKAIGRLQHPNIIGVHEISFATQPPYIVMDFVQGISLSDLVAREGTLELARTLRVMTQVADALQHAHTNGVVHRDLKPSNIMLVDEGPGESAKILDFGIAKINEPDDPGIKMTQTGEIFGSPAYMSPEQSLGKKVDERTDQYAFGCVLFECLTGCPPFMGENAVDTLMRQIHFKPPSLKEASLGKTFPLEVEKFIARMLEKEPNQRFASMAEVKRQISELLNPPNTLARAVREAKKADWKQLRLGAIVGLTIGIAVGGCVAYSMWLFRTPTKEELNPHSSRTALSESDKRQLAELAADNKVINYVLPRPTLRGIDISSHEVGDKGMWAIARLRYLQELKADGCQNITDRGAAAVQYLRNLQSLSLGENRSITDRFVPALLPLPLVNLYLGQTGVSDKGVAILSKIQSLRNLNLADCNITDACMPQLGKMHLQALNLTADAGITNKGFEALKDLKTLKSLELDSNPQLGPCLEKFSGLDLTNLSLRQTAVRDSDLNYLVPMKHLAFLDLSYTGITDDGLLTLAKIKTLAGLKLRSVNSITAAGIARLRKALPKCSLGLGDAERQMRDARPQAEPIFKALDKTFDLP